MAEHRYLTDQQLLQRYYGDSDSRWLGTLLSRYTLLLFGVAMKYLKDEEEAKDAVQYVFLKALTELPKYRVTYVKSWLYMIAKNHCLMLLRNKGQIKPLEEHPLLSEPTNTDEGLHHMADREKLLDRMDEAVSELNTEQQTCIKLFYLEKLSYQEIAGRTGYNLLQVKSHIQNGKRNLRIILQKKPEHES
jgi:RNA polymerase sigma-70 factor (ECF subfamily)